MHGRAGVNRASKWLCIPLMVVGLISYPVLQVLGGLGLFSGGQQWEMRIWPFLLSGPLAILSSGSHFLLGLASLQNDWIV